MSTTLMKEEQIQSQQNQVAFILNPKLCDWI